MSSRFNERVSKMSEGSSKPRPIPGAKDIPRTGSGDMANVGAATFAHVADIEQYDLSLSTEGMSNSIASPDEITRILRMIMELERGGKKIFVDSAEGARLLIQNVIRVMADVGTSRFTRYDVVFSNNNFVATPPAYMDDVASVIKQVCTLRQFAAFFAPVYWNWAIAKDEPPANWARKGGTEKTKFACFDFFFGLTNAASMGGRHKELKRQPTPAELTTALVTARVGIVRAEQEASNYASHYPEVTRGRIGGGPSMGFLPAPESVD